MNEYMVAVILAACIGVPGALVLFSRHQAEPTAEPRGARGGEGMGCTLVCMLLLIVGVGVCIASMAPE